MLNMAAAIQSINKTIQYSVFTLSPFTNQSLVLNASRKSTFSKYCDKGKILATNIFSFSHIVFHLSKSSFAIQATFRLSFAYSFNLDKSKILSSSKEFTIIMEKPLKILWEKEKMLLTKKFFSHSVFYAMQDKSDHFIQD